VSKIEKLLAGAQDHLDAGEEVLEAVQGTYEVKIMGSDSYRSGILLATDRRVVFYAKKLTGFDLESFPYQNISSIEMGKKLTGHHLTFFASGNRVSMKHINDLKRLDGFLEIVRGRMNGGAQPISVPTFDGPDVVDQIKRLGELRDSGVLTELEFEEKKADLLKRL
jgi:hypothetical protein